MQKIRSIIKQYGGIIILLFWVFSAVGAKYVPFHSILRLLLLVVPLLLKWNRIRRNGTLVFMLCIFIGVYCFALNSELTRYAAGFIFPVFIGMILAYTANRAQVEKTLSVCSFFCIGALFYELFTGTYIVEVEDSFMGHSIFHCGLFANSKESGTFLGAISLFIIKQKRAYITITFCIVGTLITGCRTATVMSTCALIYSLYLATTKVRIIYALAVLCFIGYVYSLLSNYLSLDRVTTTLSLSDEGNSDRIDFMLAHLRLWWSSLSIKTLLFGSFGSTTTKIGNGMESAFLRLLIDGGVPMLLFYIYHIFPFIKKGVNGDILMIVFVFSMTISGFGLGFTSGSLLWFYIYSKYFERQRVIQVCLTAAK